MFHLHHNLQQVSHVIVTLIKYNVFEGKTKHIVSHVIVTLVKYNFFEGKTKHISFHHLI
jgi:hypothetical protein